MTAVLRQQETYNQYTADGVTLSYSYTFFVPYKNAMAVYITPPGQQAAPLDQKVDPSLYTVTNLGVDNGGFVIFLTAPANGAVVTLNREVPAVLDAHFSDVQTLNGQTLDDTFEQLVLVEQQNQTQINTRVLRYAVNSFLPGDQDKTQTQLPLLTQDRQVWMRSGDGIIAATIEEGPDTSVLRAQLANEQEGTDGAGIVGYYDAYLTEQSTVRAALNNLYDLIVNPPVPPDYAVTGEWKFGYFITAPAGWVLADDGTIGNAASNATTRANADTSDLFTLIWADNTLQLYSSAGLPIARGVSAAADFAANNALQVSMVMGRAIAVTGQGVYSQTFTANISPTNTITVASTQSYTTGAAVTLTTTGTLPAPLAVATTYYIKVINATTLQLCTTPANVSLNTVIPLTDAGTGIQTITVTLSQRNLAEFVGEENHALVIAELAPHTHDYAEVTTDAGGIAAGGNLDIQNGITDTGSGNALVSAPHNTMQPTFFLNAMIKL